MITPCLSRRRWAQAAQPLGVTHLSAHEVSGERPAPSGLRRELRGEPGAAGSPCAPLLDEGTNGRQSVIGHMPRPDQVPEVIEDIDRVAASDTDVDVTEKLAPLASRNR